ncbi:MAG: hypothetical protein Kow0025_10180 [Thermodesulfovibrionales bacterium]
METPRRAGGERALSESPFIYRKIDGIGDIKSVLFVLYGGETPRALGPVAGALEARPRVAASDEEALAMIFEAPTDLVFIAPAPGASEDDNFRLCRALRDSGYQGILILLVECVRSAGGVSGITSTGFDNYCLLSDSPERVEDTIHWAILNRKRKNKYIIQFDNNPDSFLTLDREGRLYDINKKAAGASSFTPKEIVRNGMKVEDVGCLKCFKPLVRPLITGDNVEKVFSHTVEEDESVFQIKTRVHNVPTIGLVATVVKTDITRTIFARTMDILVHSITLLSQRDNYTAGHSSRVFYYCTQAVRELGLSKQKKFLRELYFAALLHDVGKIGVRDEILMKPGRLTRKEFGELATHSVKGYNILKRYKFLRDSIELVRSHHERPDGRGYPDKLRGNRISLGASIIAVADGYDAMTTNRPYRKALSFQSALAEIRDNLGTQYNREAGLAFLSVLSPELTERTRSRSRRPLEAISRELMETVS